MCLLLIYFDECKLDFSSKVSLGAMRLLFVFAIALTLINCVTLESCYQVYICCKRAQNECVEYCPPFVECYNEDIEAEHNELITTTEDSLHEINTNEEGGISGVSTYAVLTGQLCRKGHKFVGNKCRKII